MGQHLAPKACGRGWDRCVGVRTWGMYAGRRLQCFSATSWVFFSYGDLKVSVKLIICYILSAHVIYIFGKILKCHIVEIIIIIKKTHLFLCLEFFFGTLQVEI